MAEASQSGVFRTILKLVLFPSVTNKNTIDYN